MNNTLANTPVVKPNNLTASINEIVIKADENETLINEINKLLNVIKDEPEEQETDKIPAGLSNDLLTKCEKSIEILTLNKHKLQYILKRLNDYLV